VFDIAHRAALLYSFALLLIAGFVQFSGWSSLVNLIAAGAMALHFFGAVGGYILHGCGAIPTTSFATSPTLTR
jgi:hypothetical protein